MKRIYSFVLMATLLVGTNLRAEKVAGLFRNNVIQDYYESVQEAIDVAQSGDEIKLIANTSTSAPIWLGTAAVNGTPKSLTLDLNGYSITSGTNVVNTFILSHGALKVKNSIPGQGGIFNMYSDAICAVFMVHGSYERGVNPRTAAEEDLFSFLTIEEGVDLHADFGSEASAIIVRELITYPHPQTDNRSELAKMVEMEYSTDVYRHDASWTRGVANGVRVDVKGHLSANKYGVQVNGNLRYPNPAELDVFWKPYGWPYNFRSTFFPTLGDVDLADTAYVPYVHIYPSAVIKQETTNSYGAAAYASGYAHWLIEGTCVGATGLYMKGGEVILDDAKVTSAWNGEATLYETSAETHKTGVNSGGHAIVVESVSAYPGEVVLIVEGDTKIETEAQGGAALFEIVGTTSPETKVDSIVVKGGSFTGGEDGYSMVISPETFNDPEAEVIVYGTTVNSGVNIGGASSINDILASNTHTTVVTNSDNTTTVIVSEGAEAPAGVTDWAEVENGDDVNWQGFTPVDINANFTLGEMQMISGTSAQPQHMTIEPGATLVVNRLIMNEYAQIVVKAGAKLIVSSEQGINAPSVDNIVLEVSETNPANFLFNPAVTSNRHPNATVEFTSKSVTNGSFYTKQRFGIPAYGALKSMKTRNGGMDVQTALSFFSYVQNDWYDFGWLNIEGKAANLNMMSKPFDYYQMQHNTPNMGTIVTMQAELYGNSSPKLTIRNNSWNGYANSYVAPINGFQLISMIPDEVDKAFYLYDMAATYATWEPVTLIDEEDMPDIQPMQPFLLRNTQEASTVTLDYATAVWEPAMNVPGNAPMRHPATDNITKVKLIVKGEDCIDRVTVAQGGEFTADFDNGYDAVKYMNDGINMYVTADENMSVYATDDLADTYIGLQTVKGGIYTMEFTKVQGEELMLIDHETSARVAMAEGNVYEFTAAADSRNDYRFEIVSAAKVPTAVESTESKAGAKGIYTITGQYVGGMNVWNSLPDGIYVVNGAKRVK